MKLAGWRWLQLAGVGLLISGFAGPWVYTQFVKTGLWGWQPVWTLLNSIFALNIFGIAAVASCFSYVELHLRQGKRPLRAILGWVGGFLGLVILVPIIFWVVIAQSVSTPQPQISDGSIGWGAWLALAGVVVLVAALRWGIVTAKQLPT